jgi:hypothetical protein
MREGSTSSRVLAAGMDEDMSEDRAWLSRAEVK